MNEVMAFPNTWEEFEQQYGFTDTDQIYTNGSRLIQSFRVKQWLDHMPSANQWIPCSERLPSKDGDYPVTYEKGYAEEYGFDLVGIAPFEVDCGGFGIWQKHFDHYTLGSLGFDWVDIPCVAWMELPQPYKGDY